MAGAEWAERRPAGRLQEQLDRRRVVCGLAAGRHAPDAGADEGAPRDVQPPELADADAGVGRKAVRRRPAVCYHVTKSTRKKNPKSQF